MKLKNLIRTAFIGVVDGWNAPHEMDCKVSFKNDKVLENVYERSVNLAQVTRLAYEVYKTAGATSHVSVMPNEYLTKTLSMDEIAGLVRKNHYNQAIQN